MGGDCYVTEDVILGFRRLSIIDQEAGMQPMFNEDKSKVLVFNGEIYNYKQLRLILKQKGHIFQKSVISSNGVLIDVENGTILAQRGAKKKKHKKGIPISNWFLRRIENKDTNGKILYAKIGYVTESGNCAASMASDSKGKHYICVTVGSSSNWRCIYDHVDLYKKYLPKQNRGQ